MKKILLFAITCLTMSSISLAQSQTIRFALEASYPPFEFMNEKNEIEGFDIDIANAICQAIDAKCTYTHQAFDSLIPSLKFRRFDAVISAMDITPERQQQVSFTAPYYDNSAIFITTQQKATAMSDLNGKKIGLQNGTTHQKYLQDKHPGVTVVAYDSYQNAILDLKNGRLDAVFGDTAVIAEWLKTNDELVSVGEEITDPEFFGTGLAIAVRQNNDALLEQLNKGLQTIKDNGTYQTIYNKWFAE
jgi:lysine-arginine-ornithine-binding periplasmic protein